jgi:hypothetical protein
LEIFFGAGQWIKEVTLLRRTLVLFVTNRLCPPFTINRLFFQHLTISALPKVLKNLQLLAFELPFLIVRLSNLFLIQTQLQ